MEDWDIISPKDVIGSEQLLAERTRSLASAALPFTQSLLSQVPSPTFLTQFLLPATLSRVRVFAYALVSLVFRWAGPCPESSRPSAGLMGRRSSLSSPLWATLSFTVTSTDRASWHDPRNSDCGSTMVVWSPHCARCSTCVLLALHTNPTFCRLPENQGWVSVIESKCFSKKRNSSMFKEKPPLFSADLSCCKVINDPVLHSLSSSIPQTKNRRILCLSPAHTTFCD